MGKLYKDCIECVDVAKIHKELSCPTAQCGDVKEENF